MGPELMTQMRQQAERFGTRFIDADVDEVDSPVDPLRVQAQGRWIEARALIIATGASAKWLGIPGEERLRGHGVTSCATCDGFFFRDQDIVVVGGGDSAMEEAMFLTKFASKVTWSTAATAAGQQDHAGAGAARTRGSSSSGTAWSRSIGRRPGRSSASRPQRPDR